MASNTIVTTHRLRLSPFTMADLSLLHDLHCDSEVNRFLASHETSATRTEAERHLTDYVTGQSRRGFSQWKVSLPDETFVGRAGFSVFAETSEVALSICLKSSYWGKGYASELADALVEWYFENTYYTHLIAFVAAGNAVARRMMESIGFRLRQRTTIDDMPFDCLQILSPALARRFATGMG